MKVCVTSPGDVPSVTPLEYFDPNNPTHVLRYFSDPNQNGSDWTLYDGLTLKGVSTCCHYIVGGAFLNQVNGAYKYVSPGEYHSIANNTIQMKFDGTNTWYILDNSTATNLYYCSHPEIAIPPFENWVALPGNAPSPRVICSMIPSGLVWSTM